MARRVRTAKKLAQRIDLSYFKRPHPFRRWRLILSIAVPAVAVAWVVLLGATGNDMPYSSGPVSSAHTLFGARCEVCHRQDTASGFRAHVTDASCLACHDAPRHSALEQVTPACASCHLEHRGAPRLALVSDRACASCHANLQTSRGTPRVARTVTDFTGEHPEFAPVRSGRDPGRLKFNHATHLKPALRGVSGTTQLACADCHRTESTGQWRFARAARQPQIVTSAPDVNLSQQRRRPGGGLMTPMSYEMQCAGCHPLDADPRLGAPVPHEAPEVVRTFVLTRLRDHLRVDPSAWRVADAARRLPLNWPRPLPPPRTPDEWIGQQAGTIERLLWRKTCQECHTVDAVADTMSVAASSPLPRIVPPQVPERWLTRAVFDHGPHRLVTCASCHTRAETSTTAADLLLPGIESCRTCHRPDEAAASGCAECHTYHDWRLEKPAGGHFRLRQLTRTGGSAPSTDGDDR